MRCIPCEQAAIVRNQVQKADTEARAYLRSHPEYKMAYVVQNAITDEYTWCLPGDDRLYTTFIVISEILG